MRGYREFPCVQFYDVTSWNYVNDLLLAKTHKQPGYKRFIDAFFSNFSAFASPLSRTKAYNMAESHTNSRCQDTYMAMYMHVLKRHGTRRYYGIIRNYWKVGKLSACANSGPGYEASCTWRILFGRLLALPSPGTIKSASKLATYQSNQSIFNVTCKSDQP